MVAFYIIAGVLGLILLYVLILWLSGLRVDMQKEYTDHSPFHRFLIDSFTAVGLWVLGVHIHVTGAEQVPAHKRVLFISNHISNYDPIVTWRIFRRWNMAYISKPSNFRIPIFGRLIRRCGFLAIDRENPRNAMRTIQSAAALLQSDQFSVGVYPEGTRSKTGQLLPFHNGVFKIAQRADADIVVLHLSGTSQIRQNYLRRRTHVYLDVLTVLPAEQIKHQRTEQIGEEIRRLLLQKQEERNSSHG